MFRPGGRTFRTPADVQGALILVIPSSASRASVEALGGVVYQEGVANSTQTGDRGGDSDSGVLGAWKRDCGVPACHAMTRSRWAMWVLFPKYQMLVANDQALTRS